MKADDRERLLANVDAFCVELRPHEELCYLEHRQNDKIVELGHKHDVLGMPVPTKYGGREADATTYSRLRLRGSGARGPAFARSSRDTRPSASTRFCATAMTRNVRSISPRASPAIASSPSV